MKKLFAVILAIILVTLCGCSNAQTNTSSNATSTQTVEFTKPSNYVTVVKVTINPEFNLYLDINNNVLAVEPVNNDAKDVIKNISKQTGTLDDVINNIVVATNDGGYTKADEKVTVNFEITEIKDTSVKTNTILETVKESATTSFSEIKITAEIKTAVSQNAVVNNNTSTSSNSPVSSNPVSSKTPIPSTPNYTPILQKGGSWVAGIKSGDTYYDVTLILTNDIKEAGMAVGDKLSSLPEEVQENMKPDCELRDGEYYYFGRGDAGAITSVTENGTTITLIDEGSGKIVFTRTAENKIKLKSASENCLVFGDIPIGSVLNFTTEN